MNLPIIQSNVSLKPHNTLAVDALSHRYVKLHHAKQLTSLFEQGALDSSPFFLGQGSNLLITQPIKPLVIHNQLQGFTIEQETSEYADITIASGENWHQVVCHCIKNGYYGLENLSLIPGTVGAAPVQNIGAYGVEIKDTILKVSVFDTKTGQSLDLDNKECQLTYRDSIFKQPQHKHWLITAITLRLNKTFTAQLDYPVLADHFKQSSKTITANAVANAVIAIRQSKLPDPSAIPNAGSFFKNPIIHDDNYQRLIKDNPSMPSFPTYDNQYKIPAAWLIEQCGWKGKREGDVSMHHQQSVVLINHGNATGQSLLRHTERVSKSVKQRFGIQLIPEVNIQ
ncbi:MAG: UDP-N-acetylenolpyruvoylglucosamine reductase [Legionellales bacterium]|nr:UDP-N-acetylenolpyruvoylglucosamine reductase [Legionellales bacterium]HAG61619.1 UDP-N-acetylenolpyruvoylglucosamine reductase [Coxiellaceae bacterium]|tara:strand:+ start:1623 stop:2642 length:1020 start_codon:yes stop_codon:yes gene_type:complete